MIGQLLDRAVSVAFPGWGLRRASARAALSVYASADKGRKNRDWNARNRSADAAIIPDAATLNARARQMVRDSHIAKSIILSKVRNIAGRGITPIPIVSQPGPDGTEIELTFLNRELEKGFWAWANDPSRCDVEGRRTFWQFQQLAISEKTTVGEGFVVWSYTKGLGFRLQAYEAEQLDETKQISDTGNEIRGGIEVNADGKAVAYWFFLRNPNDYLYRKSHLPVRIPAERVFHFYRPERVLQTRGVSELAPVLQRIRDVHRRDDAELMSAIMEACLGMAITRNPTMAVGAAATAMQGAGAESGASATTPGGMRKFDFAPGMIAELEPGEDVKFNAPTRPGGGYEPFTRQHLRAIGAGVDLSYEQVNRDFSQGTYSSQRQGLLEDRRAWQPEQDLLTDLFVAPAYRLWIRYAVLEGRISSLTPELLASHYERYTDAEYVPDGHDWIDPEKEANAAGRALELRLTTRKEIIGRRGGRYQKVFDQLKAEKDAAAKAGITFPEDAAAAVVPPGAGPGLPGLPAPGAPKPTPPAGGKPDPAGPAAADAAPGAATPDAGISAEQTLNGAQIASAVDVVERMRVGTLAPEVAVELLVAVGIPRDKAEAMAKGTELAPPVTTEAVEQAAKLAAAKVGRIAQLDCGTGAGGFKAGNKCAGDGDGGGDVAKKISSIADRAAEIPGKIYRSAKTKVVKTYRKLQKRYGKKMAIAIMAAGLIGAPIPLPGAMILTAAPVIAAAEIHRALSGPARMAAEPEFQDLSPEEIERLGKEFIQEIGIAEAELSAAALCEWRTIGTQDDGDGERSGGGKVCIGDGGTIEKGPEGMPGNKVADPKGKKTAQPKKEEPKPEPEKPKPAAEAKSGAAVAQKLRDSISPEKIDSFNLDRAIDEARSLPPDEFNELATAYGIAGKPGKSKGLRLLRDILENQAEAASRIRTMRDDR